MLSKFSKIKLWFKEFFRRCPRKLQFTKDDPPLMIIGHRGAPYTEPENTIPSFEQALAEGANGLELDLVLTADKNVIIWHDWDPNDTTSLLREAGFEPFVKYKPHPPSFFSEYRKNINELTVEEIRANYFYKVRKGELHTIADVVIPTLEEFLIWTEGKENLLYVFFDIKVPASEPGCAIEILDLLKVLQHKYNPRFQVIIETFYVECFNEMKKAHPDFTYSLDVEPAPGFIFEPEEYSAVDAALKNGNDIAIAFRPRKITFANWTTFRRIIQIDRNKIKELRKKENKIKLVAATISKKKELRCMVRSGVDGIQTDFPGKLVAYAKKYKRNTGVLQAGKHQIPGSKFQITSTQSQIPRTK
jgi:glycerophosphoryl diester phosphodiesterase